MPKTSRNHVKIGFSDGLGGGIGTVGTKTTTIGSAATQAVFGECTVLGGAYDHFSACAIGGARWVVSDGNTINNANMSNFFEAFRNAYNAGRFNSLSGSLQLTFADTTNGNAPVTLTGTISGYNGMTSDKLTTLINYFTLERVPGNADMKLKAKTNGEMVTNTVLEQAILTAMQPSSTFTMEYLGTNYGNAGSASVTRLDFGTLTGSYLAENNIKLTVDGVQYSFVTSGSSSGTQIRVGENDSGAAIATAVANAVTNVSTSASGSAVTFTENIKYLDANHYFRGYSGQALAVDLSDNPQAANNNPNNTPNATNSTGCWIQAGPNAWQGFYINFVDATAATLGVTSVDVSTHASAQSAIDTAQKALNTVSSYRAYFGAMQNRMEHAYDFNMNAAENATASESLIRDVDMASEMLQYSCNSILEQAGQSMLAQANQARESMLSLLP